MRILIAEDEPALAKALVKIFEKNNCSADAVNNGEDAIAYLEAGNYDVLVLDVMMPRLDGISALKRIRASGNDIPTIILSAKAETDDKVEGLDSGANYYLTKPFDAKELLATLRAVTRPKSAPQTTLTFGNLTLDRATFELSANKKSFRLANKEFQMMEMLMSNPRCIVSVDRFMEKIWGFNSDTEINVVWVYISYLRKKLSALDTNVEIRASRNAGYSLEEKT